MNEEVDPALVIKRLKQEIRDLKDEIRSVSQKPVHADCSACTFVLVCIDPISGRDSLLHGTDNLHCYSMRWRFK